MKKKARLPYKKKLKLLAWGLLPVLFICYKLAVSPTIMEYRLFTRNSGLLAGQNISSGDIATRLHSKHKQLDGILDRYMLDTVNQARNLLTIVTTVCNQNSLQLKEYKPLYINNTDSLKILTRMLTVEGKFSDCLQMVYALEKQYHAGRVSSVHYKTNKISGDKILQLLCTIYIQNIAE
jgi:hypothetical protein